VIHALHKHTDLITPVKPDTIAKSNRDWESRRRLLRAKSGARFGADGATSPPTRKSSTRSSCSRALKESSRSRPGAHARVALRLVKPGAHQAPTDGGRCDNTGNGTRRSKPVASAIDQAVDNRGAPERFRRVVRPAHERETATADSRRLALLAQDSRE